MKQCITVEVAGETCHLIYNNQAMFDIREMFPGKEDFLDLMSGDGREQYEATLEIFAVLAEQAELVRSYYGYPPSRIPDMETLGKVADAGDWLNMKNAIYSAVVLGTQHHVEPIEDVDVTLLEFQNKKNGTSP